MLKQISGGLFQMAIVKANTVANLTTPAVNPKIVLPPLKLPPFPEKLLKIVPELKAWQETQQREIDTWLVRATVAIQGQAL